MSMLVRKAGRDLWHWRGQVLAISLIIASGAGVLIMSLSTLEALRSSADAYYRQQHFAEVFAHVTRAPQRLLARIRDLPGVQLAESRIVRAATVDIDGFAEPVTGLFVSLPDSGRPLLNQPLLRRGQWLTPGEVDGVLLNEPFAEAHGFEPGDQLVAILNGHRRNLHVRGVVLSPEFIYSLAPGALMPDDERYGVMWASRGMLEAAFDLDGAFNDVTLTLYADVETTPILEQLDALLAPFGGVGAVSREHQISNWFVMNELQQLTTMATILPTIFLSIGAFLTHALLSRMLTIERSQIGLLKAFGYNRWEVGLHYTEIVLGMVLVGIGLGIFLGSWLGLWNTRMYTDFFRFPVLLYRPSADAVLIAAAAAAGTALSGALGAVSRAMRLPSAQAMLPPAPPSFAHSVLARHAWGRWLDQPTRIIMRNIARWPGRALLTVAGMAASVALLVLSLQWSDSLDRFSRSFFYDAQRQHVTLGMAEPRTGEVLREVARLPGVLATEPLRIVAAQLSHGHIDHRGSLTGVVSAPLLRPIYDEQHRREVPTPEDGIVLGTFLAEKLGVEVGDRVWVEILQGRHPKAALPVVGLVETYMGMPAYMHIDRLNGLLKEPGRVEYVSLLVDPNAQAALYRRIKSLPQVAGVMLRQAAVDSFDETLSENLMVFVFMFSALACVMGFGVAYNSARITLSERGRELATLRVLGFTKGEISYILLGEVAFLTVLALPLGCILGWALAVLMASAFNTELFRVPLIITPESYATAVLTAISAFALSALIVRRRVRHLNLIEVLKTRE